MTISTLGKNWKNTVLAVAGVLAWSSALGPSLAWSLRDDGPRNDFVTFYAAGRLLGSGGLYDPAATRTVHAGVGVSAGQHRMDFLRPPVYAWVLSPLGWTSYRTAYLVWQVLSLVAFAAAAWMWSRMAGANVAVAAAWNLPMAFVLLRGQDTAFLLLAFTLAAWCLARERQVAGGLLLSCCLFKWSFCLALPLLLLRRGMWRATAAAVAGAAAFVAVSFAVAGPGWPAEYWNAIMQPSAAPHQEQMISLNGLVSGLPQAGLWEVAACLAVALCAWVAAGFGRVERALAAMLLAGVLISHHAYLYDCVLLFPFAVMASRRGEHPGLRVLGGAMLVPVFLLLLLFPPLSLVPQAAVLAAMVAAAWAAMRVAEARPESAKANTAI